MYLRTLGQYLTHFPGRAAVYVEAEGTPSSAGKPRGRGSSTPSERPSLSSPAGVRFELPLVASRSVAPSYSSWSTIVGTPIGLASASVASIRS
jgi:hypothetical protein